MQASCDPLFQRLNEISACILNGMTCGPHTIEFWDICKIWLIAIIYDLILHFLQGCLNILCKHGKTYNDGYVFSEEPF